MPISHDEKKQFQTIGHHLSPIVIIAKNGLSDGVISEVDRALLDHELIKIKLAISDIEERKQVLDKLTQVASCEVIQYMGKIALIYKKAVKPNKKLSNIIRHQNLLA